MWWGINEKARVVIMVLVIVVLGMMVVMVVGMMVVVD